MIVDGRNLRDPSTVAAAHFEYGCIGRPAIQHSASGRHVWDHGFWQIRARDRHDFAEMVLLDIEYLERVSMIGDAMILLKTIPTVLRGRGSY